MKVVVASEQREKLGSSSVKCEFSFFFFSFFLFSFSDERMPVYRFQMTSRKVARRHLHLVLTLSVEVVLSTWCMKYLPT